MHIRPRPMALAPFLLILTLFLHGQGVAGDRTPQQPLQATMHAFFQALTSVFPWSLDAQQFQAPAQRQRIQEALQALAQHAEQLDTHGQDVPQSFGFLRRSLARSAHDAAERYSVSGELALSSPARHLTPWRGMPDRGTLDLNGCDRRVMVCGRTVDAP